MNQTKEQNEEIEKKHKSKKNSNSVCPPVLISRYVSWLKTPSVHRGHGWRVDAFGLSTALRCCLSNTRSLGTSVHAVDQIHMSRQRRAMCSHTSCISHTYRHQNIKMICMHVIRTLTSLFLLLLLTLICKTSLWHVRTHKQITGTFMTTLCCHTCMYPFAFGFFCVCC